MADQGDSGEGGQKVTGGGICAQVSLKRHDNVGETTADSSSELYTYSTSSFAMVTGVVLRRLQIDVLTRMTIGLERKQ